MKTQLLNELTHLVVLETEVKNRIKITTSSSNLYEYKKMRKGLLLDIHKAILEIDSKELNRLTKNN